MGVSVSPPGLQLGRIVHFIPGEAYSFRDPSQHLVGVIVKIYDRESGMVNLRLLLDGTNDHLSYREHEWKTSVHYDETATLPYSWHYPEKEP